MDENGQITIFEWQQWKEDIRQKLQETAGNFVHIGYRLKQIRDSKMFDGETDIFAFAQKEYGLSKSTVSRFIAINERFSEGGNSLDLKEEYRNIGSSKLSEMLTLTDSECQLITERTTIREIRELKQLGKQRMEEDGEKQQYSHLQKCIIDYFKDKRELLNETLAAVYYAVTEEEFKKAMEVVNPSGYATHKKGLVFLFMYDWSTGVKYKLFTEPQPTCMSWKDFLEEIYDIYTYAWEEENDAWKNFYGEQEEQAVATSQQESENPVEIEKKQASEEPKEEEKETEEKQTEETEICESEGVQVAAGEEYQTPHPEGVTSVCYSCVQYETCDAKTATCTYCDQYKNRAESYKTEEQQYSEEQDRIDKETKKKLQDMEDEEKMKHLPSDSKDNEQRVHEIKIGNSFFEDVCTGKKNFELRKNDRDYKEGDILEMSEYKYGQETGKWVKAIVTYLLEDYTGLEEGYCVMGIQVVERSK